MELSTTEDVEIILSVSESMVREESEDVEIILSVSESMSREVTYDGSFSTVPTSSQEIVDVITGSNDFINYNFTKEFENIHDNWGTASYGTAGMKENTHFISPFDTGSEETNNTAHIESRYVFIMVGDVEVMSGSIADGYIDDFTNMRNFYNQQFVDEGKGFTYKSYFPTGDDGPIDGRAMGKTRYFWTGSNGTIKYPVNHVSNFTYTGFDNKYGGTQNTNPGIMNLQEQNDFSTASFYSNKVSTPDGPTVQQGTIDLDDDGNLI